MSSPFDSTTLDTGNELISKMAAKNKRRWEEILFIYFPYFAFINIYDQLLSITIINFSSDSLTILL